VSNCLWIHQNVTSILLPTLNMTCSNVQLSTATISVIVKDFLAWVKGVITVVQYWVVGVWPGVGLLYFHMYNKLKDDRYLRMAGSFADVAVKQLRRRGVSLLGGDAGPLALGAVVYQRLGRMPNSQDCLERWAFAVSVNATVDIWSDTMHLIQQWTNYINTRLLVMNKNNKQINGNMKLNRWLLTNFLKTQHGIKSWILWVVLPCRSWHSYCYQSIIHDYLLWVLLIGRQKGAPGL